MKIQNALLVGALTAASFAGVAICHRIWIDAALLYAVSALFVSNALKRKR